MTPAFTPFTVRLAALRPRYVAHPDAPAGWSRHGDIQRYGMGLEIECPVHGGRCSIRLWLKRPQDGGPAAPVDRRQLYGHHGAALPGNRNALDGTFAYLTLDPQVMVPGCFYGWVYDGNLCVLRDLREPA